MKPSQNVQFCTTYRLYILCCFTFSFHILSRIKRLPTRTLWAVHLLQFLDDLQFSGDFLIMNVFPYWTLNWSFPFLLLWIYIYMYIGFKSCLFCFPEDWCVFSAFPCVPMSFDLAGARVVPLMGLGGAAGGDYGFPLQALEVPTWRLGFTGVP